VPDVSPPRRGYDAVIPSRESCVAVRKIAVTLPEELFDMVERLREIEHRSRSEVFQEALRRYFGEPVYEPTDEERRLLDDALAAVEQQPDAGRPWGAVRAELWPE
jgi:Arc/MetJ-type ribon-helix-helix transcriptional regulator